MNIEKALLIDGGMNPIELEWLAEQASKCRFVVEVGSLRGRSARAMADNMKGSSVLYCVDHFRGSAENEGAYADGEYLYRHFTTNLRDHLESGRVRLVQCASIEAVPKVHDMIGDLYLDMVFIDASHDYDSVTEDITWWKQLLRPGGLLSGHDYGHFPIEKAVQDIFGGRLPTVPGGSIWHVEV